MTLFLIIFPRDNYICVITVRNVDPQSDITKFKLKVKN